MHNCDRRFTVRLPLVIGLALVGACGGEAPTGTQDVLEPTSDIVLSPGEHTFTRLSIPAGITVSSPGELRIRSSGPAEIAGVLHATGAIDLRSQGDLTITGEIRNGEPGAPATGAGITLHTDATLSMGTRERPATLSPGGPVTVSNREADHPARRGRAYVAPRPAGSAFTDLPLAGVGEDLSFAAEMIAGSGLEYRWSFGDGSTASGAAVTHAYQAPGVYAVELRARDGSGQEGLATAVVVVTEDGVNATAAPALSVRAVSGPDQAVGEQVAFAAYGDGDESVEYTWDFGDGTSGQGSDPTHAYGAEGVYPVTVTASRGGHSSSARLSVFVHGPLAIPDPDDLLRSDGQQRSSLARRGSGLVFLGPGDIWLHLVVIAPPSAPGRPGASLVFQLAARVVNLSGTLRAGDGGGFDLIPRRTGLFGRRGGDGGHVYVFVRGILNVIGLSMGPGNGGRGEDHEPPGAADARGGNGGRAGQDAILGATGGVLVQALQVQAASGGGGGAGIKDATEGAFVPQVRARGGVGGNATAIAFGVGAFAIVNQPVQLNPGFGGHGGSASANGSHGASGAAAPPPLRNGADGGDAFCWGSRGGAVYYANLLPPGLVVPTDRFVSGDGGGAGCTGGNGGVLDVVGVPGDITGKGGNGGKGTATGGAPGSARGGVRGQSGQGFAWGGKGGRANILAVDRVAPPGQPGWSATATGGNGGEATANNTPPNGAGFANGGEGGEAIAWGGRGAHGAPCEAGGKGGDATSTGGTGGPATAPGGDAFRGRGGDSGAKGGNGGNGGAPGGAGGAGGRATATVGPGRPDGDRLYQENGLPGAAGGGGGGGGLRVARLASATADGGVCPLPDGGVPDGGTDGGTPDAGVVLR